MGKTKYCDQCGEELAKGRCLNRDCEGYAPRREESVESLCLRVCAALHQQFGAYFYAPTKSVVFPGRRADHTVSATAPAQIELQFLLDRVLDVTGRPDKEITPTLARRLLSCVIQLDENARDLPWVQTVTRYPVLQRGETKEDRPWFPACGQSDRLRFLQDGVFYTGSVVSELPTGRFEEWLSTVRCADEENRQTLREWMIGTLLTGWYDPGSAPALLLCATRNGLGKTETAKAIGHILGGFIETHWGRLRSEEELARKIMTQHNRMVLIDNLSPRTSARTMLDYADLAALVTKGELVVKRLYASSGSVAQPNHYSYVLTANVPLMTPELLSRCSVVTLSDGVPRRPNWLSWVKEHRDEIVADLMYTVIDNWRPPKTRSEDDIRWDTWAQWVQCVTGVEPQLMRGRTALVSPWDWLFTRLWQNPMAKREELSEILFLLQDPKVQSRYQTVLGQEEPTRESIIQKLQRETKEYGYECDEETKKEYVVRVDRSVRGGGAGGSAPGAEKEGGGQNPT